MHINKFSFLLFLLSIHLYTSKEPNLDFLDHRTIDALRQIYWSSAQLIPDENIKKEYKSQEIFDLNETEIKAKIKEISNILLNQTNYDIDAIKQNKFFEIKIKEDIKNLIKNDDLPKNFLINFAFNLDKYSRIENQEINGALDYINYLTKENLRSYLLDKLTQFPILINNLQNFKKYILNDIDFNFNDIDKYLKTKTKKELINYIYCFERYCFGYENEENSICQIPYKMYDRDNIESYSECDLNSILNTYKRKLNITKLSTFISKIENQGFSYINPKKLFSSNSLNESRDYVKAFETYYRRHNKDISLKKLDEYIKRLSLKQLNDILEWAVNLYPELNEKTRFKDILSSETNLQYGQVKSFLKISERFKLLKYAYNIHTYQNKIKSKYDNDLINFIRMNENKLLEQISKDTNNNIMLQERTNFEYYASLHEGDLKEYLKNLQRNQLKDMTKFLINLSYLKSTKQDTIMLSEKKDILESVDIINDEELLNLALKYLANLGSEDIYNIQYLQSKYDYSDIPITFKYLYNIIDFFRSTDINYLRIWLRKYELEIRKLRSERFIAGGLKNNFMNIEEYPKKEILKIFDIYVYEYPELFYPEKFLKITGLDSGITPHKFLLENEDDEKMKEKIVLSLTGHMQRKNIQINFDYDGYLSSIFYITEDPDKKEKIKLFLKRNFLFSIFKIINIFPELNNMEIFKRLCLDESTRIINTIEFKIYFNSSRNLSKIYNNIQRYYSKSQTGNNNEHNSESDSDKSDEEYKIEIVKFIYSTLDEGKIAKILDGEFYSIVDDCQIYFEDDSEIVINNVYSFLYNKKYLTNNDRDKYSQINSICEAINKNEELQNVTFFDKEYYYIDIASEGYKTVEDLYNYLTKLDNRKIFYFCLLANFIKIDYEKKLFSMKKIKDIYLKIHFMSRNEMIRYILNVAKSNGDVKSFFNEKNLMKLMKKYFLDLGSDNVYDLTMF